MDTSWWSPALSGVGAFLGVVLTQLAGFRLAKKQRAVEDRRRDEDRQAAIAQTARDEQLALTRERRERTRDDYGTILAHLGKIDEVLIEYRMVINSSTEDAVVTAEEHRAAVSAHDHLFAIIHDPAVALAVERAATEDIRRVIQTINHQLAELGIEGSVEFIAPGFDRGSLSGQITERIDWLNRETRRVRHLIREQLDPL